MGEHARAGSVSLVRGSERDAEHTGNDGRADLTDAVGRVPDVEPRFSFAKCPRDGERCLLETVLAAAHVGDAVVDVGIRRAAAVRERGLESRYQAIGAERLIRTYGRLEAVTDAEAPHLAPRTPRWAQQKASSRLAGNEPVRIVGGLEPSLPVAGGQRLAHEKRVHARDDARRPSVGQKLAASIDGAGPAEAAFRND